MKKYIAFYVAAGLLLPIMMFPQITINSGERVKIYNESRVDVTGDAVIESGASLIIGGEMTVSGIVTNNGSNTAITIISDASATGSLIFESGTPSATIERFIAGWADASHGWHLLSSPVASQPISAFHTAGSGNDFYKWDETIDMWVNRTAASGGLNGDFETNFSVGTGYLIANSSNSTPEFSGSINNSDVSVSGLTNTSTGYSYEGWHLLGNPFSSSLKWNDGNWNLGGTIGGNCQIWNESEASYTVLSANDTIPTTNGFMVYTSSDNGSLTIPKAARVHNTGGSVDWYKKSVQETRIVLKAIDLEGNTSQKTIISFNNEATNGFDLEYDSYFIAGYAPMLYSTTGSNCYALNTLQNYDDNTVIPIGFVKNNSSLFTIKLEENQSNLNVFLVDKREGLNHNLCQGAYTFSSSMGDNNNRFEIRFAPVGLEGAESWKKAPRIWQSNNRVYINGARQGADAKVYDLHGRQIFNHLIETKDCSFPINMNAGIYLVEIDNYTMKILVSN